MGGPTGPFLYVAELLVIQYNPECSPDISIYYVWGLITSPSCNAGMF